MTAPIQLIYASEYLHTLLCRRRIGRTAEPVKFRQYLPFGDTPWAVVQLWRSRLEPLRNMLLHSVNGGARTERFTIGL
jgi:hypothetical protein